jgi:hypothetical protein
VQFQESEQHFSVSSLCWISLSLPSMPQPCLLSHRNQVRLHTKPFLTTHKTLHFAITVFNSAKYLTKLLSLHFSSRSVLLFLLSLFKNILNCSKSSYNIYSKSSVVVFFH